MSGAQKSFSVYHEKRQIEKQQSGTNGEVPDRPSGPPFEKIAVEISMSL
jgi:hypothetical protein